MTFLQILGPLLYFGTPVLIIYRWVRIASKSGKATVRTMITALGLWLLQAAVLVAAILGCISGHCQVSSTEENAITALVVVAYIAIACIFWFSRKSPDA